jgi:hypothetical protein
MEKLLVQWGAAVHNLHSPKRFRLPENLFGEQFVQTIQTLAPGGWRDYGMGPGMMWSGYTLTLHKKGGKCAYKPLQLRIILSFMGNIRCHLRWPLDFA